MHRRRLLVGNAAWVVCVAVCGYLTSVLLQRITANCVHAAVTRTMDRNDDAIGWCSNFDLLQLLCRSPSHQWKQFARVLCLLDVIFFSFLIIFFAPFALGFFSSFATLVQYTLCARDVMHVRFCTRYTISEDRVCQSAEMLCNAVARRTTAHIPICDTNIFELMLKLDCWQALIIYYYYRYS